ncbi:MAG TPA: hypothetical protein VNB49_01160 [Candidatus Dormibacteraeota bacterium]|nr:hypothetical protein [Candidatus Dormibacteraeota bacterium]
MLRNIVEGSKDWLGFYPRVGVGASFAMMEATFLLAMIQQRYQLELVPGHPIEVFASITLRPKQGIGMIAKLRKGSADRDAADSLTH